MSVYNHLLLQKSPQGNKINPNILFLSGPIINIVISLPVVLADLYNKQGKSIPQPKTGIALIDTGATKSCVHNSVMKDLAINPIGVIISHTANGPKQCNLFPAHFTFPATNIEIDFTSVVEVDLTGQVFDGQQIIALIGRDVLTKTIFIYNGPIGMYSIAM